MVVSVNTLLLELAMTLAAAFPTSAGRLPRNQQKGCNTLSTGFIALTNGSFCHTPFSLVRNPSEAAVAVLLSKVLLWGTGKGNFCLTNALWHLFQTEFFRFSWECLQCLSTVPWSKAGREGRCRHNRTLFSPRKPSPMAPPLHMGKERQNGCTA